MKKGFTLVELLVIISIISILAISLLALINPKFQLQKGRDAKRKADLAQIQAALELYRSDNGHYPRSDWQLSESSDPWIQDTLNPPTQSFSPEYLKSIPKDPTNTGGNPSSGGFEYGYYSSGWCGSAGVSYILTARLENAGDPAAGNYIKYNGCDWGYAGGYTVTSQ